MTSTRRSVASSHAGSAVVLLAVALVWAAPVRAQEGEPELPYPVLLDPPASTLASTVSLQAAARGIYALQDRYVPLRFGDEDGIFSKAGGIGYRLARLTLLDAPLISLHSVVRHEVAGHGGRVRQLGGDVRRYVIDLPPPYGPGGGGIAYRLESPEPLEVAATAAAGLESALIDASDLEERWIGRGRMDYREGLRYLYDLLEVRGYIADATGRGAREGHDVEGYIALVNGAAPGDAPGGPVTAGGLEEAAVVEVLNPTFYYALYAVLGRYLVAGERDAPAPAPSIGGVRVLPSIHLRLAPFGREYAAGVVAAWEGRVFRAGVRLGDGPWGPFRGLEVAGRNLYSGERLELGGRAGVWRDFDIDGGSYEKSLGGMAVVRGTASLRGLPLSPVLELGAKTRGFVPGEALSAGPIGRLGAAVRF